MSHRNIRVTGVAKREPDLSKLALALLLLVEELGPEKVAEILGTNETSDVPGEEPAA